MFEELVDALVDQARRVSVEQARLLDLIKAVADAAPAEEFAAVEIAFALAWTRRAAETQVELARQLIDHTPEVHQALGTGVIDLPRARVFADVLEPLAAPVAQAVAAKVLPTAGEKTTAQLRDRLHRLALAADPELTHKRRERALAHRRVLLGADSDGTATLTGVGLPAQRALAAFERVNAIAKARKLSGDRSPIDQLRADTMLDLLEGVGVGAVPGLRKGVVELNVGLATLAGLDDSPGTLAGYGAVAADIARQVAESGLDSQWRFNIFGDDGTLLWQGLTRARPNAAPQDPAPQDPAPQESAPQESAPADPVPADSALPDPVAAPARPTPVPPAQDPHARFPNAAMARWIRSRDKTCRAKGCRVAAQACDIDHSADVATGGQTRHDQLAPICRHHHRAKHEGGWQMIQVRPGVFVWISPAGKTYKVLPEPP